jgi:uncharacterized surface protein with fasciclin (FAS1) repeats
MADIYDTSLVGRDPGTYIKGLTSVPELAETVRGAKNFTIFSPTDAAFASFPEEQLERLFADLDKLAKVLRYHMVPKYYTADELLDCLFLKTLEGQRLRVWSKISSTPLGEKDLDEDDSDALHYISHDTVNTAVRESITINGAKILQANMVTDNGILHVIDKVLLPPFTIL